MISLMVRFLVGGLIVSTPFTPSYGQAPTPPSTPPAAAPSRQGRQPDADDLAARSKTILAHLNTALRFYRDSAAPIQTVGEPGDLVYRDETVGLATQIAGFAFQSAKAEAALMARMQSSNEVQSAPAGDSQAQRLQTTHSTVEQRIATLKSMDAALAKQLADASPQEKAALQQQQQQVEGDLELQTAMGDALDKIMSMSGMNETGLAAQVSQLERSAPGLIAGKASPVPSTIENLGAARDAGVTSQASVLFQLLAARQAIDGLIRDEDSLQRQALALRTPLTNILRSTIHQGQALAASTPASLAGGADETGPGRTGTIDSAASTRKSFDDLTTTFKALSGATVPLSQEILALDQAGASLQAWRGKVDHEYNAILKSLLLRVLGIAAALALIFILGEVWRRATTRYVKDVRRRRQLLVVRRLVTGFFSGLVMIFGLVTQFSSLATFAGFITAGLAVGLQTILLSVAAYFFIIGRYGVKVGDRISIAGVTGDVSEVGLVRFYVMEMAGNGTDLYPTGRIAVFSNAVLFQAGTPLYKQMPGTEYTWHELTVKLLPDTDYRPAVQEILKSVKNVYEGYREQIERQHRTLESWMDSGFHLPGVHSNLQLLDAGPQFWVRFPVMIREAAAIDEQMTESLLQLISSDQQVKAVISAPLTLKAAVQR